jgi:hypothetical protein
MASKTEIQNMALTLLGVTRINDDNEQSEEANRVKSAWEIVYRSLLSQATWNFAIKETQLPEVAGATSVSGFKHVYQLPTDIFKVVHVYNVDEYKVIGNRLHTNADVVKIKYVSDSVNTNAWSPLFTQLVATTLAAELCYTFTKSDSRTQTLQQLAARQLLIAKAHDSADDIPDRIADWPNTLISVRQMD